MQTRAQHRATAAELHTVLYTPTEEQSDDDECEAVQQVPLTDDEAENVLEKTQLIPPLRPAPEQQRSNRPSVKRRSYSLVISDAHETSKSYPCGVCSIKLTEDFPSIKCDGECERWFHQSCTTLSTEEFQGLVDNLELKWLCQNCDPIKVLLPPPDISMSDIDKAVWGQLKGSQLSEAVNNAYSIIVKWRKNMFKVPTGRVGQE